MSKFFLSKETQILACHAIFLPCPLMHLGRSPDRIVTLTCAASAHQQIETGMVTVGIVYVCIQYTHEQINTYIYVYMYIYTFIYAYIYI